MKASIKTLIAAICCTALATSCTNKTTEMAQTKLTTVGNPFMPLWEHIPDGEPYVFEDPDQPGKYRVYVYGSHDDLISEYCGRDQVVWSASVDSLNNWRYDGVILVVDKNANGEPFDAKGTADVLYAPDVTLVTDSTGKKTYYLFPNDQTGARNGLIAKSDRPDGPFEVCNWSKDNPNQVDGVLQFDPAVFVDDDGRVYGYWGFERSYAAEFDPKTMATVKPGTEIVEDMISGRYQEGKFRFFEASSIRKIKDKYVFIYSRFTEEGEFGLPMSNYTLAYCYSDNPLGPWTYGGTIIDGRAREKDANGNPATVKATDNVKFKVGEDTDTMSDLARRMFKPVLDNWNDFYNVRSIAEGFEVSVPGLEKPLVGEFDLVVNDGRETCIVDWKTSSSRWPSGKADRDLQATVFSYAYHQMHDELPLFRFDVVTKAKTPTCETYYTTRIPGDFERFEVIAYRVQDAINKGVFLPNDTSFACADCPYKNRCLSFYSPSTKCLNHSGSKSA